MTEQTDTTGAPQRTPVNIITGFLGSGKTTLLNKALRAPELSKTLVIINEFGEISLDHALAATSDDAVVVLENGCLCCTVRSDLVGTLNALYHDREAGRVPTFDNVVIETSGLADPGPVLQAFLSEPTLDGLFRVAGVVALVDAVNGSHTWDDHDEAIRQVALADTVLVSKLDLLDDPAKEEQLWTAIRAINATAKIQKIDAPDLSIAELLTNKGFDPSQPGADPRPWLDVDAIADHHDHNHHHHDHDHNHFDDGPHNHAHDHDSYLKDRGIESFALIRDEPVTRDALQFLLDGISQNLGDNLLRVKGLVNVAEEPDKPAVIQGAQHILHTMTWLDRWPDNDHRTRVVFITQGVARQALEELIELLDRIAIRTSKAKLRAAENVENEA